MKNKQTLGILALGVIALLGVSLVFAYQGDYSVKGPNYSEDRHEAMETAFENLDYDAWVALMTENGRHPRVVDVITVDNFATFVEAHEAAESGDFELAAELRAELGLGNGQGSRDGTGHKMGNQMNKGSRKGTGSRGQGNNGICPYGN
ncbi:hypothetical protein GOV14_06065 [Candidatus Pacearchaeota archaeon]|nr:hypothetical protein [Candidatus Pacearchaeota archaeon]